MIVILNLDCSSCCLDIHFDSCDLSWSRSRQDDLVGITCVLQHPSQPQLLFCGTEAGSICVWDLRLTDQPHPSAFYNCHSVLIPELRFHALSTAHLISVCYDGSALWWNASRLMSPFESVGQLPTLGSNRPAGDIKQTQNGEPAKDLSCLMLLYTYIYLVDIFGKPLCRYVSMNSQYNRRCACLVNIASELYRYRQ